MRPSVTTTTSPAKRQMKGLYALHRRRGRSCGRGWAGHRADVAWPVGWHPIPGLTGQGTWIQTGSCAVNLGFGETFTRTGN